MLVNRDVEPAGDLSGCDVDLRDPGTVGVATGVARIPDPAPTVGMASTPGAVLVGRQAECRTLDGLIEAVRSGRSRSLVVRGEAGVGKSALLEQAAARASGCRIERAVGVQSELELPYAGLHQLCGPMLDRVDRIPGPQRDALRTTFGLAAGPPPDRLLVGLAVLSLMAEVAGECPLVCLVDDAQWLDRASAQALGFVARRALAESVGLVFAVRQPSETPMLSGLPEIAVHGLDDADARALLDSVIRGPVDEGVRDRIVAETRGNPLALVELPQHLTPAELAGGFGSAAAPMLSDRIADGYRRRLSELPPDTQQLLLIAAAEPTGDPLLVWRAADRLALEVDAATLAAAAHLVEIHATVRFRHPVVRSTIYRLATPEERHRVHAALALATDERTDPDRRAWHRAHATVRPDEDVAAELERSADRARARGGLTAAAAFLERAAWLTPDRRRRAERALVAAQAKHEAGAPDDALTLLVTAETGAVDSLHRARCELLRAQIGFSVSRGPDAIGSLVAAARRLEPLDVTLARETYLDALAAATLVGHLAGGSGLRSVAEAARGAPPPVQPGRATDLLLDGLAVWIIEGSVAGAPLLRRALQAFRGADLPAQDGLRWLGLAASAAAHLWEDDAWEELTARHVRLALEAGAFAVLPIALGSRVEWCVGAGEHEVAQTLLDEVDAVAAATGKDFLLCARVAIAALREPEVEVAPLVEPTMDELQCRGEGLGMRIAQSAWALLCNALGRYEDALAAVSGAPHSGEEPWFSTWGSVELIEAAARSGDTERATAVLGRLAETSRASGTDLALGIEARSRALLSEGAAAEALYREAIDRLGRTRVPLVLARAHLVYGEWLRRERRRTDARTQLRTARRMFTEMGLEVFAQRATRELLATAETARKRSVDATRHLTPQEAHIARLARDRLSNPEIGARLFISRRTVEYHLRKVFTKLDITSRTELDRALPQEAAETV